MKNLSIFVLIAGLLLACSPSKEVKNEQAKAVLPSIDIQGHRGARGLMPENTIPAFKKALDLGVSTLELDVCVTKDGQLVVSHEPWISSEICLGLDGKEIPEETGQSLNIFQMTYGEVAAYDCGGKPNPRFPDQQRTSASKPLLTEMLEIVENYGEQIGHIDFNYNIEIKSQPKGDNIYHPTPENFGNMVFEVLDPLISWDRITIQSFDFRVVRYFDDAYPEVRLALLIDNKRGWSRNLEALGFNPDIYSPYYQLLDSADIDSLHARDIMVIPWTVNTADEMKQLMDWGVDGIITDYPNIALGSNHE